MRFAPALVLVLAVVFVASCGDAGPSRPVPPASGPLEASDASPPGDPPAGVAGEPLSVPPARVDIRPGRKSDAAWLRDGGRPRTSKPPRQLVSSDVESYLTVLAELDRAPDRAEALGPILDRQGIERAWWDELSARVVTAAIAWIPSRGMPVPDTWEHDLRVVGPYRSRIKAALDD